MNLAGLIDQAVYVVSDLFSRGPVIEAVWSALPWLLLLLNRKRIGRLICHFCGLEDNSLVADLVGRIDVPLQLLLLLLAGVQFLPLLSASVNRLLLRPAAFLGLFLTGHIVLTGIDLVLCRWYEKKRKGMPLPAILRLSVLAILYLSLVILLLDWALGVNVVPLLATSTVIAAILGLALQDTLKNAVAGLTIALERTVRAGDWVMFRLDSSNTCVGRVAELGWRSMKINTADNHMAVIPNALFIQNELINYDRPAPKSARIVEFPLGMNMQPAKVCDSLVEAALSVETVLKDPKPAAEAVSVGMDRIVYQLCFWVDRFEDQGAAASAVIDSAWSKLDNMRSSAG